MHTSEDEIDSIYMPIIAKDTLAIAHWFMKTFTNWFYKYPSSEKNKTHKMFTCAKTSGNNQTTCNQHVNSKQH